MTMHDSPAALSDRGEAIGAVTRPLAWGRTVITMLVGAALGSTYSLATRPVTAASPVELAANIDNQPILRSRERYFETLVTDATIPGRPAVTVADMIMLPVPASKSLREVAVEPQQVSEVPPSMTFRSIATLSAPSSRMEAEVRSVKGQATSSDDEYARGTGKVDAVAAVWGFLAVGLGGSTATAATMRSTAKQPR